MERGKENPVEISKDTVSEKENSEKLPVRRTIMLFPSLSKESVMVGEGFEIKVPMITLPNPLPKLVQVCVSPSYGHFEEVKTRPFEEVYDGVISITLTAIANTPSSRSRVFISLIGEDGKRLDTAVSIDFNVKKYGEG